MPWHCWSGLILQTIKWPLALGAGWCLPAVLWAFGQELRLGLDALGVVFLGALLYLLLWFFLLRHSSVTLLSTLEHELTHSLFALLTGNRVTGLKVTFTQGGHMQYLGTGNWLVDVSPYFFPLSAVLLMAALPFIPELQGTPGQALLGLTLGYHLCSNWAQTHLGQTDLQKAGLLFCTLFLPTANVCSLGLALASARAGWPGMVHWAETALSAPWHWDLLWR